VINKKALQAHCGLKLTFLLEPQRRDGKGGDGGAKIGQQKKNLV